MSVNQRMDKANVLHLHNGVLLSYKKNQWHHEICEQMDGTRKYHHPNSVKQTQCVLTHDVKQRITRLQPTALEKLGNKDDAKRDIGMTLGRGNR